MRLKKLTEPKVGMILFGNDLLVRVTGVDKEPLSFSFDVYNGNWTGDYKEGSIYIRATKNTIPAEPFEEVTRMTLPEEAAWYFSGKAPWHKMKKSKFLNDAFHSEGFTEDDDIAF